LEDASLLIDLHRRQYRQGPGGDPETLLAITLSGLSSKSTLSVADIGCGTGASSLVLAKELSAKITAIDLFPEFLAELEQRAEAAGLSDRLKTRAASMDDRLFQDASLDAIWSEGAIYNVGFENGIRAWRRYLKPGGVLAVSEITWLTKDRPKELTDHWIAEYPEVDTASAKLRLLEAYGYAPIGYFPLPKRCWLENYYRPLQDEFEAFLARHDGSDAARLIVEAERNEIALYERHSEFVSYGFYIARRVGD
jgi:cyclopropane fatty-acyl-phospholipid synthase-like methyltransferase